MSTTLGPEQLLRPGERLVSRDGRSDLLYQHDGNFVLYNAGAPRWASGTHGTRPGVVCMQGDGNLVIRDADDVAIWASATFTPHASLTVQDDGNAVIYTAAGVPVWATGTASPLPHVEPGGDGTDTPSPSTVTRLRVERNRRWFANDAGRFDWRETTAFGLAGSIRTAGPAKAQAFVDRLTRLRFTCFQILTTLDGGYWHSCRIGPNYERSWEALDAAVEMVAARGAYARLVIFGGLDNFGGHWDAQARRDEFSGDVRRRAEDWARTLASRYARHDAVILSLVNEPDQTGFRDSFDALVALGAEIKRIAPDRLLCFGGHTREGDTAFLRAPADYNDVHLQRLEIDTAQGREFWPTIKRSGENPNIDQDVMPFVHGEPVNYGDPPQAYGRAGRGDIDQSPASAFCAAATARARQYNVSFHWDGGLFVDLPPPLTVACMEAYHRGLDAFPMTEGGAKWRGHWAESFFRRDLYPPTDELEDGDAAPDDVEDWVDQNRGPWRVFGVGDRAVTIFEPAAFRMTDHATTRVEVVDRVVHGRYASGVYRRL